MYLASDKTKLRNKEALWKIDPIFAFGFGMDVGIYVDAQWNLGYYMRVFYVFGKFSVLVWQGR